jgi:Vitamin K-dependent gamma-carboxylase
MNTRSRLASAFEGFVESVSRPRRLIGASILRICLGTIIAFHYVSYFRLREFVWGPDGQVPYTEFVRRLHEHSDPFSLYALSGSQAYFECVFALGFFVTLVYIVGLHTRICGVLMFICTWSLLHRNEQILNGGHSMLLLILFYLMFADVGCYFSIDDKLRSTSISDDGRLQCFIGDQDHSSGPMIRESAVIDKVLGVIHNYAIAACVFQIMVMYLFSTLYKLEGHKWQDGTALYYILRSEQFSLPSISPLIYHNAALITIGTYATLFFQAAFPWLIFHRRLKWIMLLGAFLFHASIAILMGLMCFSASIIAIDAILIDDACYAQFLRALRAAQEYLALSSRFVMIRRALHSTTSSRVLR